MSMPTAMTIHHFEVQVDPDNLGGGVTVYFTYSPDSAPLSLSSDSEPAVAPDSINNMLTTFAGENNYAFSQLQLQQP